MAKFTVTPGELRAAAKKLETEASNYENASKAAKSAADALAAGWVGDAQKAFVSEQEKAYNWYVEMTTLARQYSAFLTRAASEYETADSQASGIISAG
ncbi:MAG TPA: WXG100 family type VII secretion target [Candidatus Limiplasma sp.]|nr:WXG100 family type VII secretion target [Candidatus Limiplasma sp.]